MNINIFLNKKYTRNRYISECISDYNIRGNRYANINLVYEIDKSLLLRDDSYNINVCISGRYIDSLGFSNIFRDCSIGRFKNINILFNYFGELRRDDICFFSIDIEHSGFLYCMVLEQVYRAYKIINREPYHK